LGEGHFIDDSDSDDSEGEARRVDSDDDKLHVLNKVGRSKIVQRSRYDNRNKDEDDDDEYDNGPDHDIFMEQMLADMHNSFEEGESSEKALTLQKQIEEEEQKQELEKF
jgi:hypothetical protein